MHTLKKIRTAKTEPMYTCRKLRFMAKDPDDQEKIATAYCQRPLKSPKI